MQVVLCLQATVQALEVVLLDDKYHSERIPSIRLKAASLSTTWSHDCTLLLPHRLQRGEPESTSNRNYFMVRTAVSCNYFNSSLDVEEALLLVRWFSLFSCCGHVMYAPICMQRYNDHLKQSLASYHILSFAGVAHLCHVRALTNPEREGYQYHQRRNHDATAFCSMC